MLASASGHLEVARLLLEAGADTDCRADNAMTALTQASLEGRLGVADWLLKAGANNHCCDNNGTTGLTLVCSHLTGPLGACTFGSGSWF